MGKVPLRPASFSDDAGLLDLSMEDVVSLFIDKEKRRHKEAKEDEMQQESTVGAKTTPTGLIATLEMVSQNLGISRAMLTRCLSHQVASWFDCTSRIGELVSMFYDAYQQAVEYGYPELCHGMKESGYTFSSSVTQPTTFRTILWVQNKLSNLSLPLGLPTGTLFSVGLCWSVSTTCNVRYSGTVNKYLRLEVSRFLEHVEDRFEKVVGFHNNVDRRLGKPTP